MQPAAWLQAPTQADLERLPFCCAVIEEGLRMVPAGSVAMREATSDIDLGTGIMWVHGLHGLHGLHGGESVQAHLDFWTSQTACTAEGSSGNCKCCMIGIKRRLRPATAAYLLRVPLLQSSKLSLTLLPCSCLQHS